MTNKISKFAQIRFNKLKTSFKELDKNIEDFKNTHELYFYLVNDFITILENAYGEGSPEVAILGDVLGERIIEGYIETHG